MKPSSFRLTSTVLLAALIIGTVTVVGTLSLRFISAQNDRTRQLVEKVAADLDRANMERERAEHIARRSLRLEAHRLRLSILVDTCTVANLEHQRAPRCHGVKQRAKHLARIVREFRDHLRETGVAAPSGGSPGTTTTVTKTRTASPPPHVGNSGNCPPSNPHCQEEP